MTITRRGFVKTGGTLVVSLYVHRALGGAVSAEDSHELEVERPADAKVRQFEDHQPCATRQEKTREAGSPDAVEVGARAREEDEARRAEVRHPAREEDTGGWSARRYAGKDADVIDRHQHHAAARSPSVIVTRCRASAFTRRRIAARSRSLMSGRLTVAGRATAVAVGPDDTVASVTRKMAANGAIARL